MRSEPAEGWSSFSSHRVLNLEAKPSSPACLGFMEGSLGKWSLQSLAHSHLSWIAVRTVLCEGGVPQRPVIFVTRKKLVSAIQQKLWKLNGEPGWVTIYGMAGCGKSVLAAEAVRDHALLEGKWIAVARTPLFKISFLFERCSFLVIVAF